MAQESSIEETNDNSSNNVFLKIMNAITYNYSELLQGITYGITMVVMCILITLIFLNPNIKLKSAFVVRSALLVVLLSAAMLLDKAIFVALIPHQLVI